MRFNLSEWAITHRALVLFMIIVLGGAGAYSYLNLGRAEDPSFTIKTMIVAAAWPGATASEMQTQVTDRIEKKLQELPYLDRVESYSQPGMSFIQVFLLDRTPPSKVKELWYQVRKKVGDIRGDLPAGVVGPSFNDEYGDVYSALYMLTADGMSLADLKTRTEDIRQQLLRVPNVNKVDLIGERPQKIFIELNHAKLATLGITPQQIFDSVARQNAVTSGGSVDTAADRINLRVTGAFSGAEAIAAVPVEANGRSFRLGDIATVSRGYEDPATFLVREGGKPALGLGVSMQDGANIIKLGEDLKVAMEAITQTLPVGIEVTQIADQANVVEHSVSEFIETFVEALAIVLLVSFISLGWRAGIVVALCVPLVLAIVLTIMYALGIDLHRITLGALIIALGLLVDDAIIAIEMMVVKMEEGWDRARAATYAWTSTAFPMLTGTLVTAAGFLPVGFAKSSAGEYAGGIFWIVGIALHRVVGRGGGVHALSWPRAVAGCGEARRPGRAPARRSDGPAPVPHLPRARPCDRVRARLAQERGRRDRADVRHRGRRIWPRPAAVLSDLEPHRAVLRAAAARGHCDRRHRRGGEEGGKHARRRSRHPHLHDLCRPRRAALLARAEPGAAEPELRPDRHRDQGSRSPRAGEGAARASARGRGSARKRGRASTASASARPSASRSSSASSVPTR